MMGLSQSLERRAHRGVLSGIAVSLATLTCTVAFGLPAGAMAPRGGAFGPHAGSSAQSPSSVRPHTVAPLTLVNIVVTDLASDQAFVYSRSSVTKYDNQSISCNFNGGPLCFSFGAPDGFSWHPPAGGFVPGLYNNVNMGVAVDNIGCSQSGGATNTAVELDQYTAQPDVATGNDGIQTTAVQFDCTNASVDISGTIAYNIVPTDPGSGYYIFGQFGEIGGYGNDNYLNYLDGAGYYNLNAPIVGMAPTPTGGGYWMVGADGGVFASGDAGFYGSTGNITLNKPVVGMAATPDGKGYWFVASDGGIFAYGDAAFYGSMGGKPLNKPIVGMAATPDGKGYWLVASDGGIFNYGDAAFYGSMAG